MSAGEIAEDMQMYDADLENVEIDELTQAVYEVRRDG
jgi:hypothetical protein